MTKTVNVAKLAFPIEDFLTPFAGEAEGFWEGAEKFDDLRYVVVVFAIFCPALRIKEVVACYELENLFLLVQISQFWAEGHEKGYIP